MSLVNLPSSYAPLKGRYSDIPCGINTSGDIFDRTVGVEFTPASRYAKFFGIYEYIPRMVLETHINPVNSIHHILFLDGNRDNWSVSNLSIKETIPSNVIIDARSHDVKFSSGGAYKNDEYRIPIEFLLDHNWVHLFRAWIDKQTYRYRGLQTMQVSVDVQNRTAEFIKPTRGLLLPEGRKDRLTYTIVADFECRDFWIIKPDRKSRISDLTRFNRDYRLSV